MEAVGGTEVVIAANPGLGNLQELLTVSDATALYTDLHAIRGVFGLEIFELPGEGPIDAIRANLRVGLGRQKFPLVQVETKLRLDVGLCRGQRIITAQRLRSPGFLDVVIVANNFARGIDPNEKLLFLLWAKKAHVPLPNVQFGGHEVIGLLQSEIAFQVGFGVFVDVKDDCGLVA